MFEKSKIELDLSHYIGIDVVGLPRTIWMGTC